MSKPKDSPGLLRLQAMNAGPRDFSRTRAAIAAITAQRPKPKPAVMVLPDSGPTLVSR